ncbi:HpcH/HpaI aldolase family protein [Sedimentitalea todarodis]|uniref:Aldolase/citrate lyase family protein n=1 Tax=Sedimentitalea todarodis TaxID=1631240 RepID=A0ABU3VCD3_9RHOB|nr:aldolase/citrate lyase family protein [Sedimentitalea todarodis]MDU9003685.1 aldolase/citrate lyase family protein [Sedimentitalea todarodis]
MTSLKAKLANTDAHLSGVVCTIPSATVTQAIAASGADYVVIDMEHGALDHGSVHAMIAATQGSGCAPLVRVAENNEAQVKRMLDLGAEGIVFPLIPTAADAERAVASLRYPPNGTRGFGPSIAQSRWQSSLPTYQKEVEEALICCLLIETAEAVENAAEIMSVPGIDVVVPAPFDLSTAMGVSGQFQHPDFLNALITVEDAAKAAGVPLIGNAAPTREDCIAMLERGYVALTGFDILWLRQNRRACRLVRHLTAPTHPVVF